MSTPRSTLPPELQDVAFSEDINNLEGKIQNCYSKDRYEDFQVAVEKIIHKELTTDEARKKLDEYVDGRIDKAVRERGWKNKTFWVPTTIAAIAAVASVAAIIKP